MMILPTYSTYSLLECVSFLTETSIRHRAWKIDDQYLTRNNLKYIQSKFLDADLGSDINKL